MNCLKSSKKIPLKPLYDLTFEDSIHLVEVVAKNRLLVNFGDSPKVLLLNERLEILESKDLQASNNHVCISENGQYIGVSKKKKIEIYNSERLLIHQISNIPLHHHNSTKCLFTTDNQYAIYILNTYDGKYGLLQVLKLETLEVVYEGQIEDEDDYCYYLLFQAPSQNTILSA